MITNEFIFGVLRKIIMQVTTLQDVILADQNQTAPLGEYATIRPRQSIKERGQANVYAANGGNNKVSTDVRSQIMCTCSVNFYRGRALEYAEALKQCNKLPTVSIALYKAKLGWNGTRNVNNLTTLQSSNQEQRANIDIILMYESGSIDLINNILFASVDIENEKGEVLQSIDVP